MSKYKKAWILLHEKVANRVIRPKERAEMAYKSDIYAEISAMMAEVLAEMMCEELEGENK